MSGGRWIAMMGLMIAIAGCGQSGNHVPATVAAGAKPVLAAGQQGEGPDRAVFDFLEAVRTGNDDKAAKMLTPLARQKVAEQHLVVAPQGTDTAHFEVRQVQLLAPDGARVSVKWSDLDENGKRRTDEVLWMLRRVEEGWRVAGVAAPVFEGEPPLLLNFEDPADMIEKQKMVREEVKRRAEQASVQSTAQIEATNNNSPTASQTTRPVTQAPPAQNQQAQGNPQSQPALGTSTMSSQGPGNAVNSQPQQAAKSEISIRR
jgi:hypothetical protein